MTIRRGDELDIHIETAPDVFTPVNDLFAVNAQGTRSTTSRSVFMNDTPYKTRGPRERTVTIQGIYNPEDAGQAALFAALAADPETNVTLRLLYDGESGYSQEFQIDDDGIDSDPDAFSEISFGLSAVGAKTPVTGS